MENTNHFYRITDIEYIEDGSCLVGVESPASNTLYQFNLARFCYRSQWLSHFRQPDLETVWQLTRRQKDISVLKKAANWFLVKYHALKQGLANWEQEAKAYLGFHDSDFDQW